MKILFLVFHGFSDGSGITKKIRAQVRGLRQNGHEVSLCYYDVAADGHRQRYVDGQVLCDYGTGMLAGLRQRTDYGCVADYCQQHGIELVYARSFQNASPWLIGFFRRLRKAGIHAVMEVPTYPYDHEFDTFSFFPYRLELKIDQLFRRRLCRELDAVVTFSDATEIFGQKTIRISNGVDFDAIPIIEPASPTTPETASPPTPLLEERGDETLHLIGVAEVHSWHGFDRLIAGLGEYYEQGGSVPVVFHIVGGVAASEMQGNGHQPGFAPLIERYGLQEHVVFHGQLFGEELDRVFNECRFAVGSLGRHRSGITVIKTLKNREYATRGIPFIYSEQDSDFDHQPYVLKAPADESPIDIQRIISFMDGFTMKGEDIRHSVEHLTWKIQMQRVVDAIASGACACEG